jgi:integrase
MADTVAGRTVAARILAEIQLDIYNGELDFTLAKYKRNSQIKNRTIHGLWCQYVEYKKPNLKVSTLDYYQRIVGRKLEGCPYGISQSLEVRRWLLDRTTARFTGRILNHFCTAVDWAIRHGVIDLVKNPYLGMGKDFKPNAKPPGANAFSADERDKILDAFLRSDHYEHYYPFVYFLFLTGCRPSEAIGLRWRDISDDFSLINFSGSIALVNSKHVRMEGSKTNRVRSFPINTELRDLLEAIAKDAKPDRLIFPSRTDPTKPIDYINFSHRAWAKVVPAIVNRKTTPYSCRDTFITLQVAEGIPLSVVAKWVDNSPRMIGERYFDVTAVNFLPK